MTFWDGREMTYEELISYLHTAIENVRSMGIEPTRIIVNEKYKDYGKEYLIDGDEYKTVYGIPLVFRAIGRVNFIVETDEF